MSLLKKSTIFAMYRRAVKLVVQRPGGIMWLRTASMFFPCRVGTPYRAPCAHVLLKSVG